MTPRLLPLLAGLAALGVAVKAVDIVLSVATGPSDVRLASDAQAQTGVPEPPPAAAPTSPPPTPATNGGNGNGNGATAPGAPPPELEFNRPVQVTDSGVDLPADLTKMTRAEVQLLTDLAKRRQVLDERERRVAEREAILTATEGQMRDQQAQLLQIKQEIEALVQRYEADGKDDLASLIETYKQMKPRSAALIWNDMDLDTLVPIARGIPPRQIAPVIAAMEPEKARLLTRELAVREQLPALPQ